MPTSGQNTLTGVTSWKDADKSLLDAWRLLGQRCNANPTLQPDWIRLVADAHNCFERATLLTAIKEGQLALLTPIVMSYRRHAKLQLHTLDLVANIAAYHNALVTSLSAETALGMLIDYAYEQRIDCVYLAGVDDASSLGQFLRRENPLPTCHIVAETSAGSPYLPLEEGWDGLVSSKAKKFRYKLRKRNELLEREDVTMRWLNTIEDCQTLLDCIREVEEFSWKKEAGHAIFDNPAEARYHTALIPFLAKRGALLANVLYLDKKPIAYNLCCHWGGWIGQLKTSFDMRHSNLSPGSLVIDRAIKQAITLEAYEFDFLGDTDQHKLAWSKHVRHHQNYYLYLKSRWKGNLVGKLKHWSNSFSKSSSVYCDETNP